MNQLIHLCIMHASQGTRDSVIDAAIQVLSANPTATLAEIAEAAGVRRVTVHRLFGSRDELLKQIAIRSLRDMEVACDDATDACQSAIEALRAIVGALVPVGDRFHFLWKQTDIWNEPSVAQEIARQDEVLFGLIDQAKAEGAVAADIPNAWLVAAIEAVVFAALSASREGHIAVNDAADLAVRTLFAGLESPVQRPTGQN